MLRAIRTTFKQFGTNHQRIQRLFKEGGWVAVGQIASVLGTLLLVRVLTEYLQPLQYGQLALGLTVAGLVNQVIMGGISNGIGRFYSIAAEHCDLYGYLQISKRFMGYATLACCAIALVLMAGLLILGKTDLLGLMVAVMVLSIVSGYNSTLNGIQNAARQRSIVALHSGMDAWLKIALVVGVLLWFGSSSTVVVFGYMLSTLLVTLSQLLFLRKLLQRQGVSSHTSSKKDWARQMWQFSWPFSAFGLFTWAQQVSDRWALETFASTHDVGQYAVVYQLGYVPISLVTGLIMTLVGPILYQRSGGADDHERNASVHLIVWRITGFSLAATGLAFAFTYIFHAWLFHWLVAEAFRSISHYLPWVVFAGGLFATGQLLSLKLMSEIRSRELLLVKISTALLGVGANLLGAWWYGVAGVVAGLVVFSSGYLGWMLLLAYRLPEQHRLS